VVTTWADCIFFFFNFYFFQRRNEKVKIEIPSYLSSFFSFSLSPCFAKNEEKEGKTKRQGRTSQRLHLMKSLQTSRFLFQKKFSPLKKKGKNGGIFRSFKKWEKKRMREKKKKKRELEGRILSFTSTMWRVGRREKEEERAKRGKSNYCLKHQSTFLRFDWLEVLQGTR